MSKRRAEGATVSVEASETVTVPRVEWDSLRAEVRRLRRELGQRVAVARIKADPGPGDGSPTFSRDQLAEAWGIAE
jgi:hypothetical protein